MKKEEKETVKDEYTPVFPDKEPVVTAPEPMRVMTELDSYINERIKSQPTEISDVEVMDKEGLTRLSLPEYFEQFSYDCTRGMTCRYHKWKKTDRVLQGGMRVPQFGYRHRGEYLFRWILRDRRALDYALNARGWYIVNRSKFDQAPKHLFSVSGAVEEGDMILSFMPVKKALHLREQPARKSREDVKSTSIEVDNMGNKYGDDDRYYKPKLNPERAEGSDDAPSDSLQEGRDF